MKCMNTPYPGGPIPVVATDIVGYLGNGSFAILKPYEHDERVGTTVLPIRDEKGGIPPFCTWCTVDDGQVIYFGDHHRRVVLRLVNGKWLFGFDENGAVFEPLLANTFFEIAPNY